MRVKLDKNRRPKSEAILMKLDSNEKWPWILDKTPQKNYRVKPSKPSKVIGTKETRENWSRSRPHRAKSIETSIRNDRPEIREPLVWPASNGISLEPLALPIVRRRRPYDSDGATLLSASATYLRRRRPFVLCDMKLTFYLVLAGHNRALMGLTVCYWTRPVFLVYFFLPKLLWTPLSFLQLMSSILEYLFHLLILCSFSSSSEQDFHKFHLDLQWAIEGFHHFHWDSWTKENQVLDHEGKLLNGRLLLKIDIGSRWPVINEELGFYLVVLGVIGF